MFPIVELDSGTSILSCIIFCPLLGIIGLFATPASNNRLARFVAITSSAVTCALSLLVFYAFTFGSAEFQFMQVINWLPSVGANYIVGIDGINLWLVMLTTFLSLLVIISAQHQGIAKHVRAYLVCVLALETGILGTLLSLDAVTFYVFWELMLLPMYFLIGIWGSNRRLYAAIKFVLFTAFGSLLMLVAIAYCGYLHFKQFGEFSFFLSDWTKLRFSFVEELLVFSAFALAFAIKIPIFPLHTWLPDAHVEAPTGGSVLLAGVLLKLGLYGLIRFGIPIFPVATQTLAPLFVVLGLVGIIYGALVAWVQTDIKKLVAYSSISHLGFCVVGYGSLNFEGLQGCLLQMVNHGISTSALFLLVGALYVRKHTREISAYKGLASIIPVYACVFMIFVLSSIGLPLTNGFVGEFLLILSAFKLQFAIGAVAVLGVILSSVYMLSLYRRVAFGPICEDCRDLTDLSLFEIFLFLPLILLVFGIGIYPQIVLDSSAASSQWYVDYVTVHGV